MDEKKPDVTMASALERLAAIAEAQAAQTSVIAKQNAPKSLEVAQIAQRSAFNPRGEKTYKMPRLQCDIYAPWKIDPNSHGCTREEVELLNLLEPGIYAFELNDGETGKCEVIGTRNDASGKLEELHILPTPKWTDEHKQRFKSLAAMLREMLGDKAAHVVTMKAEHHLIASGKLAVSVHG